MLPSRREGYGLVVLEALSRGTPVVVAPGEDNAAVELVVEGENGFVAPGAAPDALAAAIDQACNGSRALREATLAWFRGNARRLLLDSSLEIVAGAYGDG